MVRKWNGQEVESNAQADERTPLLQFDPHDAELQMDVDASEQLSRLEGFCKRTTSGQVRSESKGLENGLQR